MEPELAKVTKKEKKNEQRDSKLWEKNAGESLQSYVLVERSVEESP